MLFTAHPLGGFGGDGMLVVTLLVIAGNAKRSEAEQARRAARMPPAYWQASSQALLRSLLDKGKKERSGPAESGRRGGT